MKKKSKKNKKLFKNKKTLKTEKIKLKKVKQKNKKNLKIKKAINKKLIAKIKSESKNKINSKKIKKQKLKVEKIKVTKKIATKKTVKTQKKETNTFNLSVYLSNPIVRQNFIEIGGEQAIGIIKNLNSEISDEELARKINAKVSDVRAALNKLQHYDLVGYKRSKNSDNGWYSYLWYLKLDKIKKWSEEIIKSKKEEQITQTNEQFFFCPQCKNSEPYNFSKAFEYSFHCPYCNSSLEFLENVHQLKKEIREK